MLSRSDGKSLLYASKQHGVHGEPESGKGWLVCRATADVLGAGGHVFYFDFEDCAETLVERLLALGVEGQAIRDRLHYIRPDEPLTDEVWERELSVAFTASPELVVIDGVTEALALHNLSLKENDDIAKWQKLLPRRAQATGAAVVQVDHVSKDREGRRQFAIGGQHKLAAIDVAYSLERIEPLGRGREGVINIVIAKDRPGYVREYAEGGKHVALMRVVSEDDGQVRITLEPPRERAETFRPTGQMERVSHAIEETPGLGKAALRGLVKGKNDVKDAALELLLAENYVEQGTDGKGRTHKLFSLKPYRESEDEAA